MTNFKKYKNVIWIILLTSFFAFLILDATMAQIDPAPRYHIFQWYDKLFASSAFWTTQTNWMFFIFFIFVFLNGKWKLWNPSTRAWIGFLSYMTLTMVLFWAALFSVIGVDDKELNPLAIYTNDYNSVLKWFITVVTHLITFIVSVTYFFIFEAKKIINIKKWYKKDLLICCIFPFFYVTFVSLRMIIMNSLGQDYYFSKIPYDENFPEWVLDYDIGIFTVPYFFFNYRVTNGIEMYIFGSIGCLLLITICQYLWIKFNNIKVNQKAKLIKSENKSTWDINKLSLTNEIIKVILFSCSLIVSIIFLLKQENYQFQNSQYTLYNLFYLFLYSLTTFISLFAITLIFIKIITKKENRTFDFLLQTFSMLFLIHFFCISLVFLIPVILSRKLENKNDRKRYIK